MPATEAREAGLTLAQYAAVRAGTAEPFALDEVLGIEGIDAAVWAEAELAWTARLASDEVSMKEYGTLLAAAQDRLSRKIDPIAGDVEAWLAFLAEYVAAANAQAVLDRRGLGVNDLARLSRTWARRLEREPELQKRAAEIRRRGPKKLSPLVLGARRLRASGLPAPVEDRAASPAKSAAIEPAMDLERYARLSAELLAAPRDRAGVLARFDLTAAGLAALDDAYRERLRADAAMASDFARLRDHHRARIAARASAPPDEAPRSSPKPVWNIEDPGTVVAAEPDVAAPALPFRRSQDPVAAAPARASAVVAGGGSDGETVTLPSPFAQSEMEDEATVIRASPFASAPPPLAPASPIDSDPGTSAPVPSPFADNPLPFEPPRVTTPAITKRVEPPPVRLDSGTVSAVMSPFAVGSPTPFGRDRARPSSPLPPPKPPPRRKSVAPPAPTSTRSPAPVSTRAPTSQRAPLSTRAPVAADAHAPMTLERHAALCAEVAIQPGYEAEVLARNGVDGDLKVRADRFWKEQAAKDPATRAAWTRAFDAYPQMFTRGR